MADLPICYLCQEQIEEDEYSQDHVPAEQFFPFEYRSQGILKLDKLPAHVRCNTSFQRDEDYLFATLSPIVEKVFVAAALWKDIKKRTSRREALGLSLKVRNEFSGRLPSGIHLPGEKVVKRFDGPRVYRIIWKIVRGLFFIVNNRYLPESQKHYNWLWEPELPQPEAWGRLRQIIVNQPSRGNHPGVFDYKYASSNKDGVWIHAWGLLFWDRIIFMTTFHDPDCGCSECSKEEAGE